MEMIEHIENGKIKTVVTKDLSRLGRNYLQVGLYTEMVFPRKGVRYIAINDGVDSAQGDTFRKIARTLNEEGVPSPRGFYYMAEGRFGLPSAM